MKNAGIDDGDIMVIDKSIKPTDGCIAICFIDGEFTAKLLLIRKDEIILMPENEDYSPIRVTKDNEFIVWGVVTHVIKAFYPCMPLLIAITSMLIAIARKISVVIWNILKDLTPYNPALQVVYEPAKLDAKIKYHQKEMERIAKLKP